jgi:hypothetical protein
VGEVASADVVIIEVDALSVDAMLVASSRRGLLQAAVASETPVWVESGVGRLLPPKLWSALVDRLTQPGGPTARDFSYVVEPTDCVKLVVGPAGTTLKRDLASQVAKVDCPEPSELTARW